MDEKDNKTVIEETITLTPEMEEELSNGKGEEEA